MDEVGEGAADGEQPDAVGQGMVRVSVTVGCEAVV